MKHRILTTALAAGLVGIASAHASPMHEPDQLFNALDADGNGQLSQPEVANMPQAMGKLRFQKADSNDDGQIDKDEFMAQSRQRAERLFKRMDANGDGHLDASEARPPKHAGHEGDHAKPGKDADRAKQRDKRGEMFKKMDRNGDGSVSREEFDQAMQRHRERMQDHHDKHAS
ncbi:calcium-binding EF-hand domain-containing protein [Salinisphaera sp. S4-8]|uniref:EF-hand domain-containing protein n=1 Tax=Salinisphaera sp. S4-8 TaxID=633357 RepID=UPI00333E349E